MSSSASSSSDSSRPSSPAPNLSVKRKRHDHDTSAQHDDRDDSDSGSSEPEEDVPALSHAEKRRQKKKRDREAKQAGAAAPGDDLAAKRRKTNDGAAVSASAASNKEKRQNSVWVGNLSFKTTPDALRGFFDGVGEITRLHMPTKVGATKGENMGFAYVDFASPDQKTIAISLSEREFQGRRLLIKDGGDFTGRPAVVKENAESADHSDKTSAKLPGAGHTGMSKTSQKILRIQKQPPAPTLFLGNLGFEATEKSIRELFEAHRGLKHKEGDEGEKDQDQGDDEKDKAKDKWIRKIRMGTFEDTGNCKGWAFIDFTSIEHATAALVHPKNHRLDGRSLVVEYASPDAVRRGGGGPRPKSGAPAGEVRRGGRGARTDRKGSNEQGRQRSGEEGHDRGVNKDRGAKGSREGAIAAAPHAAPVEVEAPRDKYLSDAGGYKGVKGRSKPGAALALAKRESAAIVASQGKKTTF